jgi:5-methyltetrahydrofolate--homocysteine methyltransferase
VLLNRRPDATERLVTFAETVKGRTRESAPQVHAEAWRSGTVEERLAHALVKGIADHVEADTLEALEKYGAPLAVIEGPLMAGMNVVGDLFGSGKMFLPAGRQERPRDEEVGRLLTPFLEAQKAAGR